MTKRITRALAVLASVVGSTGLPEAAQAADALRQPAVPIDARVPSPPAWIAARDGWHAFYEVHLVSYRALPLEILKLEVLDAADGRVLATVDGQRLLEDLSRPGRTEGPGARNRIEGGALAVLYVELLRGPEEPLPAEVRHLWYLRRAAGVDEAPAERTWLLESGPLAIRPAPRFVLGPPLRGEGWVAANGLGNRADHRRALFAMDGRARISQRYAIDFVRIGPNGLAAAADPPSNEDFFGYGAELLAVADGTVVAAHDGMPENTPFSGTTAVDITLETIAGNHVLLDIGGAYVMYAHLKRGSAKVRAGQAVKRGEVLGLLGNSGNSDGPHLHIQVTDLPAPLAAEGLPFTFESFRWQGRVEDLDAWTGSREPWQPPVAPPAARRAELPLAGDVVAFPD